MSDNKVAVVLRSSNPEKAAADIATMLDAPNADEADFCFEMMINEGDFKDIGRLSENGYDILSEERVYLGEMVSGDLIAWLDIEKDEVYRYDVMDGPGYRQAESAEDEQTQPSEGEDAPDDAPVAPESGDAHG